MSEHCHDCGLDQSIDETAQVCATLLQVELEDDGLATQAKAFLKAYLTRRHNRMSAAELPKIGLG